MTGEICRIIFECIFKLVVALTFLMCVVCSQKSVFLFNVLRYIFIFIFFVCFIFLNERQQKEGKKKKKKKERRSNHELNFLYGNLFGPIIFSS